MRKVFVVKQCFFALLGMSVLALASSAREDVSRIRSIKVEKGEDASRFIIEETGRAEWQDFVLKNPDRLVLDFIGARHELKRKEFSGDGNLVERVRTSQFTNTPEEITRVVFDLREEGSHRITRMGSTVIVEFLPVVGVGSSGGTENTMRSSFEPFHPAAVLPPLSEARNAVIPVKPEKSGGGTPSPPESQKDEGAEKAPQPVATGGAGREVAILPTWKRTPKEGMDKALYTPGVRSQGAAGIVRNRNITIDVQGAGINTVLRSISEFSGSNIIAGPEVTGEVTAHLKNVPWRQALTIILKAHGYGFKEEYGVIRVSTIDKLTKEDLEKQAAERKKDDLLPLVTRIIPLSYANAKEMKDALESIVSSRGNIEVEKGNNALIVTDIEKNAEKVAVMVKELDRKINQVEIVAKLVDVDVEATREMGIRWDLLNLAPANVGVTADAVVDAVTPAPLGTFRIGTVRSWGELQAAIEVLEKTNKANIISNPRIVTTDNREASILVGKEIPLIVADEAGNPITELTKIGIILRVTPHVNSDHTITLDLHPEVSELSAQATVQGGVVISMSEADTRVIVADGETAVIGGLINEVESSLEEGIPVLKDVPFLGNLFKYKNKTRKKRELIIFITPRIVSGATSSSS